MSRFHRDRLLIGIDARSVTLVRLAGFWKPVVSEAEYLPTAAEELASSGLHSLERQLRLPRWQGTNVQIVLADPVVRYFVAPLPSGVRGLPELREANRLRFEEVFGVDEADWSVVVERSPLASHHLGCAIQRGWLEELLSVCAKASLPVNAVVPFGISEINRNLKRVGWRSGWFAAFGNDSVCLAYKSRRSWLYAGTHPRQLDSLDQLQKIMKREQLRSSILEPCGGNVWISGGNVGALLSSSEVNGMPCSILGAQIWPGRDEAWSQLFRTALSPIWPTCV